MILARAKGEIKTEMKNLLKGKRALSPVVAAVILIAVAVAVSIAVGAWMGAMTFTYTKTEQLKITSMTFAGQSGNSSNTIQLAVKNTGTGKITVVSAEVNGFTKTVSETLTYDAGATGTITVESVGWTTGNKYRVTLLSSTGTRIAAYEDKA